jgi:hypothetical protein
MTAPAAEKTERKSLNGDHLICRNRTLRLVQVYSRITMTGIITVLRTLRQIAPADTSSPRLTLRHWFQLAASFCGGMAAR